MAEFIFSKSSLSDNGAYLIGKIEWNETVNTNGNYSYVNASIYVKKAHDSMTLTIPTDGNWRADITINGTLKSLTTYESVFTDWVKVGIASNIKVNHDADGHKTITISGSVTAPIGTSFEGCTTRGSKSVNLTAIPRPTTIDSLTCSTNYFDGGITYKYTPKSATLYTRMQVLLSHNDEIVLQVRTAKLGKQSAEQHTATVTLTSAELSKIYAKLPSASSAKIGIQLATYSDSAYTEDCGIASKYITLTIPASIKPTASLSVSPSNSNSWISSLGSVYVQNFSGFTATLSATAGEGATLKNYSITGGDYSSDSNTLTKSKITTSGNITFTGKATDSRSRSGTSTKTITVLPYSSPAITSLKVERGTYDAGWTIDDSGPDVRALFKTTLSLADNGNVYGATFKIDGTTTTPDYGTTTGLKSGASRAVYFFDLPGESSHSLVLTAKDSTGTSSSLSIIIPTINVTMDFNESGKGIAFGKTSEKDAFECAMDAEFNKSVKIGGSTIADYIVEQGKSGIWTYRKWNSGIAECWGSTYGSRTFDTTWGSLYVCSSTSAINYPFTFIERPIENATVRTTAPACWLYSESGNNGMNTTTTTGRYCAARPTQVTTSCTLYIDFRVVGRWK